MTNEDYYEKKFFEEVKGTTFFHKLACIWDAPRARWWKKVFKLASCRRWSVRPKTFQGLTGNVIKFNMVRKLEDL